MDFDCQKPQLLLKMTGRFDSDQLEPPRLISVLKFRGWKLNPIQRPLSKDKCKLTDPLGNDSVARMWWFTWWMESDVWRMIRGWLTQSWNWEIYLWIVARLRAVISLNFVGTFVTCLLVNRSHFRQRVAQFPVIVIVHLTTFTWHIRNWSADHVRLFPFPAARIDDRIDRDFPTSSDKFFRISLKTRVGASRSKVRTQLNQHGFKATIHSYQSPRHMFYRWRCYSLYQNIVSKSIFQDPPPPSLLFPSPPSPSWEITYPKRVAAKCTVWLDSADWIFAWLVGPIDGFKRLMRMGWNGIVWRWFTYLQFELELLPNGTWCARIFYCPD